jgi:hypothetical protein|eukprot:COSAG06_NODE_66490_length_254_cov_0.670968_1_plen_41_part_00
MRVRNAKVDRARTLQAEAAQLERREDFKAAAHKYFIAASE